MTVKPFFSIIIPTYNRPDRLANCLQAIANLDYPGDRFEVIVVDDGSQTPLDSVVAPFQGQIQLKLLRQANAGPAAARNRGAIETRGDFLAFTDDDCQPLVDWLSQLEVSLVSAPNAMVGGQTINALADNPYSTASQKLIDYLYEYYHPAKGKKAFFASNNIAMSKSGFDRLGGFDVSFPLAAAEDRDFCDRWIACGYSMVYAPQARIYHYHSLTLQSFWRQHFNYGRGAFSFHRRRKQTNPEKPSREPLSFYLNLLFYPFSQTSLPTAFLLAILLILSQVATTFGMIEEWSHS